MDPQKFSEQSEELESFADELYKMYGSLITKERQNQSSLKRASIALAALSVVGVILSLVEIHSPWDKIINAPIAVITLVVTMAVYTISLDRESEHRMAKASNAIELLTEMRSLVRITQSECALIQTGGGNEAEINKKLHELYTRYVGNARNLISSAHAITLNDSNPGG